MNKATILTTITSTLMCACNELPKAVDFPLAGAANTTRIVVEKVERNDSATTLTIRGFIEHEKRLNVNPV